MQKCFKKDQMARNTKAWKFLIPGKNKQQSSFKVSLSIDDETFLFLVMATRNLTKAILTTGLIAGTLDATAACIQYTVTTHKNPVRVFWYIASAIFGQEAYTLNPTAMAICGVLLHYLVALIFTTFFFLIYPNIVNLARYRFVTAIVYGLLIWSIMNLFVVPTSRIAKSPVKFPQSFIQICILILCIGVPISFLAYNYFVDKSNLQKLKKSGS